MVLLQWEFAGGSIMSSHLFGPFGTFLGQASRAGSDICIGGALLGGALHSKKLAKWQGWALSSYSILVFVLAIHFPSMTVGRTALSRTQHQPHRRPMPSHQQNMQTTGADDHHTAKNHEQKVISTGTSLALATLGLQLVQALATLHAQRGRASEHTGRQDF